MPNFQQCQLTFTGSETFEELKETGNRLVTMNQSSPWWAGDYMNYMIERFPERSKVISISPKWQAFADTARIYSPDERVKGVSFEIHAFLRDKDDRHKQLVLAHQEGHTLKEVKDRNEVQMDSGIGKGKRLTKRHLHLIDTCANIDGKRIEIAEKKFSFDSLKDAELAGEAIKLAVEAALKER